MDDLALLEQSVLNFALKKSIEETRSDSKYTFNQIKIHIETIPNNGGIESPYGNLPSKCFFISVAQSINKYVETSNKETPLGPSGPVTPYQLMTIAKFYDLYDLVDTANPVHQSSLQTLVKELDICIHLYIGENQQDKWYATPDPSETFGNVKSLVQIRVLNMGAHFECITTPKEQFIRAPRTMNDDKLRVLQRHAWSHYRKD